jgi:hypothetical protein
MFVCLPSISLHAFAQNGKCSAYFQRFAVHQAVFFMHLHGFQALLTCAQQLQLQVVGVSLRWGSRHVGPEEWQRLMAEIRTKHGKLANFLAKYSDTFEIRSRPGGKDIRLTPDAGRSLGACMYLYVCVYTFEIRSRHGGEDIRLTPGVGQFCVKYLCICVHVCIFVCVCTYICIYIYTRTNTQTRVLATTKFRAITFKCGALVYVCLSDPASVPS